MTREEAVKRLKERIDRQALLLDDEGMAALTELVPELAESEDERIKKELIAFFQDDLRGDYWHDLEVGHILAWLEKQKEQKPAVWSDEDEKIRLNLMSLLSNMRGDRITEETYQKYYPWLKSLRPSWKPSEEQMAALYIAARESPIIKENGNYLYDLYNDLKKL